ncbi:hypothetical protein O1611_g2775 [Lasiodiplodia mahajangana]|uniref:Uncharacterized protein n=1 Tax=Lasiodiplodia mahajangana TaxID=1108764 RepID=A0ACC2JUI8_9PEZI|nr:hypothetical protein O1611_g2775 [Lasiodiplodia mahajangana]
MSSIQDIDTLQRAYEQAREDDSLNMVMREALQQHAIANELQFGQDNVGNIYLSKPGRDDTLVNIAIAFPLDAHDSPQSFTSAFLTFDRLSREDIPCGLTLMGFTSLHGQAVGLEAWDNSIAIPEEPASSKTPVLSQFSHLPSPGTVSFSAIFQPSERADMPLSLFGSLILTLKAQQLIDDREGWRVRTQEFRRAPRLQVDGSGAEDLTRKVIRSYSDFSGDVQGPNGPLFVEREGNPNGQSILFVHGLGGTTNSYQTLVSALQDFDLVRFDLSGHGRSSVPRSTSIHSYMEDCEALVLFGPVCPPPATAQTALADRAAAVRQNGMAAVADIVISNAFAPESLVKRLGEVALAREMLTRQNPEGYALAVEALKNSTVPQLGCISAPTKVVTGEEDKVSTVETGRFFVDNIGKHAEQIVLPSVGHWHMLEASARCVEIIKNVAV